VKHPISRIFADIREELLARPFIDSSVKYSIGTLINLRLQAVEALRELGAYKQSRQGTSDKLHCGLRTTRGQFCRRRLCPFCWTRQIIVEFRKVARLMSPTRSTVLFTHSRSVSLAELPSIDLRYMIDRAHLRAGSYADSWAQLDLTPMPDRTILLRVMGLAVLPGPYAVDVGNDTPEGWPGHLPPLQLPGSIRVIGSVRSLPALAPYYQARCDWMKAEPAFVADFLRSMNDKTLRSVRGAFRAVRRAPSRRESEPGIQQPATVEPGLPHGF
jgi:hypothetical protein